MDIEIESRLDAELNQKLKGAISEKNTVFNVTTSMGIGMPHLVPFVTGMIYVNLQNFMVDLYKSKGIAEDELLKKDLVYFWKKNVKQITEKLTKIYEL